MAKISLRTFCFCALYMVMHVRGADELDPHPLEISRVRRGDDVSLSSLLAMLQQQAAQIDLLKSQLTAAQNTLTSAQNRLTAVENQQTAERNRMTSVESRLSQSFQQVAFTVHASADVISLGTQSTVKFDNALTNIGNSYNVQTGIFTATVAGVYSFFLNVMAVDLKGSVRLEIVKNGQVLDMIWAQDIGQTENHDQGAGQVSIHLAVGDQVWVRQEYGTVVRGNWYTVFTGYLIQPD